MGLEKISYVIIMEEPMMHTGYVYKLVNDVDDEFYVGSTTKTLANRLGGHIRTANNAQHKMSNLYQKMRLLGVEHFRMELLHNVHYTDVKELRIAENDAIIALKPSLNHIFAAGRDPIKRQANNKRKYPTYYAKHREEVIARVKRYAGANKELISERQKQYRVENADIIKAKKSEIAVCQYCQGTYTKSHAVRHRASRLCQAAQKTQSEAIVEPTLEF
jgi:hypothetical protein